MSKATQQVGAGMFDTAVGAYAEAMKAGVKVQEDLVKWWGGQMNGSGPFAAWQQRSRAFLEDTAPAAQKNAEEWLKVLEQNYSRSVELLQAALDAEKGAAGSTPLLERTRKLWEESLAVVKENTEAMAKVNMKAMELWTDVFKKNVAQGAAAAAKAAEAVRSPK